MHKKSRPFLFIAMLCGLGFARAACADSTLEYRFAEGGSKAAKLQSVFIKDGSVMVKGAGGGGSLDLVYSSAPDRLTLVDHRRRSVTMADEAQIDRLAKQSETVQPLLQGFGEQIARLNPKQRAKWQEILGDKVPLDKIAAAAQPRPPATILKTGHSRKVAGVDCEQMQVFEGKRLVAEFCLAAPAKLDMQERDYAALRALLDFAGRLASKTQGLARQFGVDVPSLDLQGLAGVPVDLRDASGGGGRLTLSRALASEVDAKLLNIPGEYRVEPFKLWK